MSISITSLEQKEPQDLQGNFLLSMRFLECCLGAAPILCFVLAQFCPHSPPSLIYFPKTCKLGDNSLHPSHFLTPTFKLNFCGSVVTLINIWIQEMGCCSARDKMCVHSVLTINISSISPFLPTASAMIDDPPKLCSPTEKLEGERGTNCSIYQDSLWPKSVYTPTGDFQWKHILCCRTCASLHPVFISAENSLPKQ